MKQLKTSLFAFAAAAVALFAPQISQAESFSYSAGGSTMLDFGELGGFGSSGGGTTEVFDIGFNAGGGADLLGCAGVSLEGFMDVFANFEHIFDNFLNNIKKAFFRRLLVEAFSRLPQIGALFDTINALGNARFEMFNESCDINSIRADAKDLMQKRCIEAGGSVIECSSSTAQSSSFSNIANQVNKELEAFHSKMSNIGVPLRGTMCDKNATSGACGLMSFLPQMKLCWNLGTRSGSGGEESRGIDGCTETRTAGAPIGSDALFNTSFSMTKNVMQAQGNVNRQLAQSMSTTQYGALAAGYSRAVERGEVDTTVASRSALEKGPFQLALVDFDYDVAQFASGEEDAEVDKLKRFLHCSVSNPTQVMESFIEYLNTSGAGSAVGGLPTLDVAEIAASDILNFGANATQLENIALNDAGGAAKLMEVVVGCTLNHTLHVSIDTFVALSQLPSSDQKAYEVAVANKVAYLSTEIMLRYLRQNVLEAHAQLASGFTPETTLKNALEATGSEDTGTVDTKKDYEMPEPVLIAVKTIADMFENQIQALRAVRLERDAFADMSRVIYQKIEENKRNAAGL